MFDRDFLHGTTRSGNVYKLEGPSAVSVAADAVWRQWCTKNSVESWTDVTCEWLSNAVCGEIEQSTRDDESEHNGSAS